jgi:hypothetical protein
MHARMQIFGGYTPEQAIGQSATIMDTIGKGVEQFITWGAMYVVVPGVLPFGAKGRTAAKSPRDVGDRTGKHYTRRTGPECVHLYAKPFLFLLSAKRSGVFIL